MVEFLKNKRRSIIFVIAVFLVVFIFLGIFLMSNRKTEVLLDDLNKCEKISLKFYDDFNSGYYYDIVLTKELRDRIRDGLTKNSFSLNDDAMQSFKYELRLCDNTIKFNEQSDNALYNDNSISLGSKHSMLLQVVKDAIGEEKTVYFYKNSDFATNELEFIEITDRQKSKIEDFFSNTNLTTDDMKMSIRGEFVLSINGDVIIFDKDIHFVHYNDGYIRISDEFMDYLLSLIRNYENDEKCCASELSKGCISSIPKEN